MTAAFGAIFEGRCKFILIFVGALPQSFTGVNAAEASDEKSDRAATLLAMNDWNMVWIG
jgi:hypothetical protein